MCKDKVNLNEPEATMMLRILDELPTKTIEDIVFADRVKTEIASPMALMETLRTRLKKQLDAKFWNPEDYL